MNMYMKKKTSFLSNYPKIGRPVAYYPSFGNFLGSAKAGVFISQLGYWEGKQKDKSGFIYKTQTDLKHETGLTRYEQETVRKALKKKGYLKEQRRGVPARMYFKIDWDKFMSDFYSWIENYGYDR